MKEVIVTVKIKKVSEQHHRKEQKAPKQTRQRNTVVIKQEFREAHEFVRAMPQSKNLQQ